MTEDIARSYDEMIADFKGALSSEAYLGLGLGLGSGLGLGLVADYVQGSPLIGGLLLPLNQTLPLTVIADYSGAFSQKKANITRILATLNRNPSPDPSPGL